MHISDFGSKLFLHRSRFFCFQTYGSKLCMEGKIMGYAGRQNIYEGTIRRMVTQALEEQEEAFRREHAADTDGQLIAYLRQCAMELQHVPWPEEIRGGAMITHRFGSWENALAEAGLPRPKGQRKPGTFLRVKEEEARQKELYRQHKAEKKLLAEKRRSQKAAKKREPE